MINYKKIKKSDIPLIYGLGRKDFSKRKEYSWDWSKKEIEKYLRKEFLAMKAEDKNKIVGFILISKNYSSQKPQVSWLEYI